MMPPFLLVFVLSCVIFGVITSGFSKRMMPPFLLVFVLSCVIFGVISVYMTSYSGVNAPLITSCKSSENLTLEKWIEPPRNLMHNMTDEQLFWRASFEPHVKKYPYKRVPKVAFMFLTKGPLPLAPLWERFFNGHEEHYSIYIHSSPLFQLNFPSSSVFYKRQIPSQVSEWGEMNICDAERRLLGVALLDIANERFVLLSESCIPLHNFTFIYNYLTGSKHSFMGSIDDRGPQGRGRYSINMLPEVDISHWRKGTQWFEVQRKLAILIVKDDKYYPKFLKFCKPPCFGDEHYFPTMLSIEAGQVLANRSLTWADWSRGGAHPATFGGSDINEEFLKKIQRASTCEYNNNRASVCYLFARKFSNSTLEALNPSVLGF